MFFLKISRSSCFAQKKISWLGFWMIGDDSWAIISFSLQLAYVPEITVMQCHIVLSHLFNIYNSSLINNYFLHMQARLS